MQQRLFPEAGSPSPGPETSSKGPRTLTVSEVTKVIKDLLTGEPGLRSILVVGEVTDYTRSRPGHLYFRLKDKGALISCVMWRSKAEGMRFQLENGFKVVVKGNISVYEEKGQYQLLVDRVQPEGIGALHQAFEQLKKRLEAEGLFEEERKRPIPNFPSMVGVVTSPTGAAVRDIIRVATERWPMAHIVIAPARVQGDGAAPEITHAIDVLNDMAEVDVIIVSRGGGGLEDLWAFNEEMVARAIAFSKIPVVTGIGHEVDTTIADYVADRAMATPSQAAELVFPNARELRTRVKGIRNILGVRLRAFVVKKKERLAMLMTNRALRRPLELIDRFRQTLDHVTGSLSDVMTDLVTAKRHRVAIATTAIQPLNPKAILGRGYSITMDDDGRVIKDPEQVSIGDRIRTIVQKGDIIGRVESRRSNKEGGEDDGEEG